MCGTCMNQRRRLRWETNLDDQRGDLEEKGLLRVVTKLFLGLVWSRASGLVKDGLQEYEGGTPDEGHRATPGWEVGEDLVGFIKVLW